MKALYRWLPTRYRRKARLLHHSLVAAFVTLRSYTRLHEWPPVDRREESTDSSNPLRTYFDAHQEGRGIWKWNHYFDIYHRHFRKFIGREVHVLEVGIYSGGSLDMWKHYFGPQCHIYGVDIEEDCRVYEDDSVTVFVGDQADRKFWKRFKETVPSIDIIIDDGGHQPHQQIVTLEEMLPHLRPGGVYICEDVHGVYNEFVAYVNGLIHKLNAFTVIQNRDDDERRLVCRTTMFQSLIHSVHFYPFVIVIEKADAPVVEYIAPKHGTEWQSFYENSVSESSGSRRR